jgi:hypothetical protein
MSALHLSLHHMFLIHQQLHELRGGVLEQWHNMLEVPRVPLM